VFKWRIYYAGGRVVTGLTREDWQAAPDEGVQVVVSMRPYPDAAYRGWTPWAEARPDRMLWTGTDEYDPFGWGVKHGSLLSDEEYFTIWDEAIRAD
jgi:hypothetical protein